MINPNNTNDTMLGRYAQHADDIVTIEEFLSWLGRKGVYLTDWNNGNRIKSRESVLEYFSIDPLQLEAERRALLEAQRRASSAS